MACFEVEGGRRLNGTLGLQGSKNGALPLLAATLLIDGVCTLENCPDLTDVHISAEVLESLGCHCRYQNHVMTVDAAGADGYRIDDRLMQRMRSSVLFLGALLGRFGRGEISMPGGCELGLRPIDLHMDAFRRMGAEISEEHGRIVCRAEKGLQGCALDLPVASVGATENILLAACLAKGQTVIRNAAKEPEIVDLAGFLRACGACIEGAGSTVVTVEGGHPLHGCRYRVLPDRIAAVTYLCAGALCGGEITLTGVARDDLVSVLPRFEEMGCRVTAKGDTLTLCSDGHLHAVRDITTREYPGFPTDAQPMMLASLSKAQGTTLFIENIFSNRFRYVEGLQKMGAKVKVIDRVAVVEGVPKLSSASVSAPDLRGGAALVVAALAADGISTVSGVAHIDRGYEKMEDVLTSLGARMQRREDDEKNQAKGGPPAP